jgi:hypothetical protein
MPEHKHEQRRAHMLVVAPLNQEVKISPLRTSKLYLKCPGSHCSHPQQPPQ